MTHVDVGVGNVPTRPVAAAIGPMRRFWIGDGGLQCARAAPPGPTGSFVFVGGHAARSGEGQRWFGCFIDVTKRIIMVMELMVGRGWCGVVPWSGQWLGMQRQEKAKVLLVAIGRSQISIMGV
jgi:hypothetical protein